MKECRKCKIFKNEKFFKSLRYPDKNTLSCLNCRREFHADTVRANWKKKVNKYEQTNIAKRRKLLKPSTQSSFDINNKIKAFASSLEPISKPPQVFNFDQIQGAQEALKIAQIQSLPQALEIAQQDKNNFERIISSQHAPVNKNDAHMFADIIRSHITAKKLNDLAKRLNQNNKKSKKKLNNVKRNIELNKWVSNIYNKLNIPNRRPANFVTSVKKKNK